MVTSNTDFTSFMILHSFTRTAKQGNVTTIKIKYRSIGSTWNRWPRIVSVFELKVYLPNFNMNYVCKFQVSQCPYNQNDLEVGTLFRLINAKQVLLCLKWYAFLMVHPQTPSCFLAFSTITRIYYKYEKWSVKYPVLWTSDEGSRHITVMFSMRFENVKWRM